MEKIVNGRRKYGPCWEFIRSAPSTIDFPQRSTSTLITNGEEQEKVVQEEKGVQQEKVEKSEGVILTKPQRYKRNLYNRLHYYNYSHNSQLTIKDFKRMNYEVSNGSTDTKPERVRSSLAKQKARLKGKSSITHETLNTQIRDLNFTNDEVKDYYTQFKQQSHTVGFIIPKGTDKDTLKKKLKLKKTMKTHTQKTLATPSQQQKWQLKRIQGKIKLIEETQEQNQTGRRIVKIHAALEGKKAFHSFLTRERVRIDTLKRQEKEYIQLNNSAENQEINLTK